MELATLRSEMETLRESIGDIAASQIMGEWSREVPQQQRIGDRYDAVRESVLEPEGGAAAQLNRALVRTANVASLIAIERAMVGQPELLQLQILNQCLEYLLAINSATLSCNLVPITP